MNEPAKPACSRLVHIVRSTGSFAVDNFRLLVEKRFCGSRSAALHKRFCMSRGRTDTVARTHGHQGEDRRRRRGGRRLHHDGLARAERQGQVARDDPPARARGRRAARLPAERAGPRPGGRAQRDARADRVVRRRLHADARRLRLLHAADDRRDVGSVRARLLAHARALEDRRRRARAPAARRHDRHRPGPGRHDDRPARAARHPGGDDRPASLAAEPTATGSTTTSAPGPAR